MVNSWVHPKWLYMPLGYVKDKMIMTTCMTSKSKMVVMLNYILNIHNALIKASIKFCKIFMSTVNFIEVYSFVYQWFSYYCHFCCYESRVFSSQDVEERKVSLWFFLQVDHLSFSPSLSLSFKNYISMLISKQV